MFDEPFAVGRTLIHRLDPRVRLTVAAASAVCLAVTQSLNAAGAELAFAALPLALSRPPLAPLGRRLFAVNLFVLFLWLTVPWTVPGHALFQAGPLMVSREGVHLALLVTVKSNAILLLFLALVASMDSPRIGHAMERLRLPSKLVFLFLFTYRYIHVIADEHRRLNTAARLRGFAPGTNLRTYRTVSQILGMVLVRSHERSVRVYEAMLLRGFQGRFQSVSGFRAGPKDVIFATLALVCLAGVTLWDRFPELLGG